MTYLTTWAKYIFKHGFIFIYFHAVVLSLSYLYSITTRYSLKIELKTRDSCTVRYVCRIHAFDCFKIWEFFIIGEGCNITIPPQTCPG